MPAIPLPNPPLTDGEIVLRAWEPRDAPAVTAALSGTATDLASRRELALAVVDGEDRLPGALGISNFDWTGLKGEIGYWLAPSASWAYLLGRGSAAPLA